MHGAPRAPSRQGATHGLERVRRTARIKKEERFTALLHHVDGDRLREAYLALEREAAPGVPTNIAALSTFQHHVGHLWRRPLQRRSQRDCTTWAKMRGIIDRWLPSPRILHPWPRIRFAVQHPRWELDALIGPVRFCAGGALSNERPYRDLYLIPNGGAPSKRPPEQ